jgi:hypothetical protein
VDYVGKLSERLKTNALAEHDKQYRNDLLRHTAAFSEFLPTPRELSGPGSFPHRRADFFCYFSLAAKEK